MSDPVFVKMVPNVTYPAYSMGVSSHLGIPAYWVGVPMNTVRLATIRANLK